MKKKIFFTSILCLSLVFLVTGCGKKEEVVEQVEEKTPNVDKKDLDITYSSRTVANEVVFYLKNKGEIDAHDVVVEVEFWKKTATEDEENTEEINQCEGEECPEETISFKDEKDTKKDDLKRGSDGDIYIGSVKNTYEFIKPGYAVAGVAGVGQKQYDYFKIFIDIDENANTTQKRDFAFNDLIVEDDTILKPTETQIAEGITKSDDVLLTVKNKGKTKINLIELAVVFYKDNEIIGYSKKQKQNLDSMVKAQLKVSFPIGKTYSDRLEFDNYRVFINKVYRDKYQ